MRVTQGSFSFLPDLTDDQITRQVQYALDNGWAVSIEYTDDPHPRNTYWEMWEPPMFDLASVGPFNESLAACREAVGGQYIRVLAFDSTKGWESLRMSFIVDRPDNETGFELRRDYGPGRMMGYSTRAYATDQPSGSRYQ
jgi:ribulose-bisphosphate carboxylase small chain